MMFVRHYPGVPEDCQISLILKTLCGFSTAEIARAFLTSEDTISKRLYRTRLYFRKHRIQFILPPPTELKSRTDTVLNSIYLLFNEGYSSTVSESLVREDLMEEAMLLCRMLTENPSTAMPETFALMALMCFHASRNDGRTTPAGEIILLADQDRSKWNRGLIALGNEFMAKAAAGDSASRYHIEAAIAFEHCTAKNFEETDWKRILELYEWLCRAFPSPISELNRAVAVMRVHGADEALKAVIEIPCKKKLETYYLYHSLVGEIYSQLGRRAEAKAEFETAITLTKSEPERKLLRSKLAGMEHFPDDGADFSR
jgi:RNA polymerase sigma-70 factor (ECF subfamily)